MPNLNSGDRNCVVSSRWRFGIPEVRREVVPPAGIEPATHGFPLLLPATPSSLSEIAHPTSDGRRRGTGTGAIISLGKEGKPRIVNGGPTTYFECDIFFANGQFFQWRSGT